MVLALVSSKGGCGKSTFSYSLASIFKHHSIRVCIIDCDISETCLRWGEHRRKFHPDALPVHIFAGSYENLESLVTTLMNEFDLIIIDGRIRLDQESKKILYLADYIFTPIKLSLIDIHALENFCHLVKKVQDERGALLPIGIAINEYRPGLKINKVLLSKFLDYPLHLYPTYIYYAFAAYNHSYLTGLGINEIAVNKEQVKKFSEKSEIDLFDATELYTGNNRLKYPSAVSQLQTLSQMLIAQLRQLPNGKDYLFKKQ